jgi:hypothetical protein
VGIKDCTAALMAIANDISLRTKERLAVLDPVTELLQDVDDAPIVFAIDPVDEVDKAYWMIILAFVNASGNLTTSVCQARDVVEVAAHGYRASVEIRLSLRRAEAELAAVGEQTAAEEPSTDGG